MVKLCTHCDQEKPVDDFHVGNGKLGRKSQCILCCRRHYDPAKAKEARRKHQRQNREECRRRSSLYDKEHKPQRAAREACRRATKLNATPSWLTEEHKKQIELLYIERDRLRSEKGIMYHVDHIVPLISDMVCGLHVPWNLQVLSAVDNIKKGNRV